MALSEDDEARELAFLLAQTPPSRVAHTFSTPSNTSSRRSQTPPSPTPAQKSPGIDSLSLAPARRRFQIPLISPTPSQQSSGFDPLSPAPARQLVPSAPSPVIKVLRSPVPPRSMFTDEAAFWVVMSGAYPGVYHGRYVISFFF
jgi:hypothetical protein